MARTNQVIFCVGLALGLWISSAVAFSTRAATSQALFERVFGSLIQITPEERALALEEKPVDRSGYRVFVDGHPRNSSSKAPILVKAVDEDGDFGVTGGPDQDSDLYIADWNADGTVDAVVDFVDDDHDQDVDEMGLYYFSPNDHFLEEDVLRVWWSKDIGDDNRLWHFTDYLYTQAIDQFRCDFGGNETFVALAFDPAHDRWRPIWENPFLFWDEDGDGVSEVVLRLSGFDQTLRFARFSFDADNDSARANPHDYDFSFTAMVPKGSELDLPPGVSETVRIRGKETGAFADRQKARDFVRTAEWQRVLLTWDELDRNTDPDRSKDQSERWEGVIANPADDFPRVGGPSIGDLNSRSELDQDNSGKMGLYISSLDHKVHLFGAEKGWMLADYDQDGKADVRIGYRDRDGDGTFDEMTVDWGNDGSIEQTKDGHSATVQRLTTSYAVLTKRYNQLLDEQLENNRRAIDEMKRVNEIETHFRTILPEPLRGSRETVRFYQDLILLRGDQGEPRIAAKPVLARFSVRSTSKKLRTNVLLKLPRDIPVARRVVQTRPNLMDRELPAALQDGNEWFLADLSPGENQFAVLDEPVTPFARKVATRGEDWLSADANIGWESEVAAFRSYWGIFEFFGKTVPGLMLSTLDPSEKYAEFNRTGMDILHVGKTAGIAGLGLWNGRKVTPLQSLGNKGPIKIDRHVIETGPLRATVELHYKNIETPEFQGNLRVTASIAAGSEISHQEIRFEPTRPAKSVALVLGFTKLQSGEQRLDQKNGVIGVWGKQNDTVQEIGAGILFKPGTSVRRLDDAENHYFLFQVKPGETFRYSMVGTWRLGQRAPFAPTARDWFQDLVEISKTERASVVIREVTAGR